MIAHQWEDQGLVRRHDGTVSLREIAQSDAEVQADPRFDAIHYIIDDFRDCKNLIDVDLELINELAAIASVAVRYPKVFRHAVVTKSPEVNAWAGDFANSGFLSHPVGRFRHVFEARQWVANWSQPAGNAQASS